MASIQLAFHYCVTKMGKRLDGWFLAQLAYHSVVNRMARGWTVSVQLTFHSVLSRMGKRLDETQPGTFLLKSVLVLSTQLDFLTTVRQVFTDCRKEV